jgi:hypothetical protein
VKLMLRTIGLMRGYVYPRSRVFLHVEMNAAKVLPGMAAVLVAVFALAYAITLAGSV